MKCQFSLVQLEVLELVMFNIATQIGGWKQMRKTIRKYSKNIFSAEIIFEYFAFCEKHFSNKIEDRCQNYLDCIKDNFILSCAHVWT